MLDADVWEAHLPTTIEAICFPAESREAEADARRVHAQFTSQFPQSTLTVPLVSLNTSKISRPFTWVQT